MQLCAHALHDIVTIGSRGAPVPELVRVTFASISGVVIARVIGYVLALRGFLVKAIRAKSSVLTPALLFSMVNFTINADHLLELAVEPIGCVVVELVSFPAALPSLVASAQPIRAVLWLWPQPKTGIRFWWASCNPS